MVKHEDFEKLFAGLASLSTDLVVRKPKRAPSKETITIFKRSIQLIDKHLLKSKYKRLREVTKLSRDTIIDNIKISEKDLRNDRQANNEMIDDLQERLDALKYEEILCHICEEIKYISSANKRRQEDLQGEIEGEPLFVCTECEEKILKTKWLS